jgi:holo-[acyl-carrier protein] synthase
MLSGIGIDIIEIDRIKEAVKSFGERFLKRVFTPDEIKYCRRMGKYKIPELAVRFAAKEAFSKALGTGMVGIGWTDIEITNDSKGKPFFKIRGKKNEKAFVSLSHNHTQATAMVMIEK